MTLSRTMLEQALGRAALVFELQELERRMPAIQHRAQIANEEEQAGFRDFFEALSTRRDEILSALWPTEEQAPADWRAELAELDGTGVESATNALLERHPEITPPDSNMTLGEAREWLAERIARLPEEERVAWIR